MDGVVDRTDADISAIGTLVPRRVAEIDEHVVELEKQLVPLLGSLLTAMQNLPRGDAESVNALAAMLEAVEESNAQAARGVPGGGGGKS
ncbi:MAG: hypothetical protein ACRDT4_19700 [Micromonosporaceae bacterium]